MWANLLGASRIVLILVLSLSSVNCGRSNALETFFNGTDDASLYQTALTKINASDYSSAVTACSAMSAGYLTGDARFVCASAYAGRCGYTMFDLVTLISGYDPNTDPVKFLKYLMQQYHGATAAQSDDCETASELLRTVGDASSRSTDENFMLILMSLTHLGKMMNALADTDDDDAADATFDQCDTSDISLARVKETGRALWEMYHSAEAMNSTLFDDLVTAFDALSTAISTVGATYNFLLPTADPDSFTTNEIRGIRALMGEDAAAGLDLATCTNFANCLTYVSATCP